MAAIGKKVQGTIVWSSSRIGNHDLFTMNTDGSNVKQITSGDAVDWFPRFSADGTKILFCRSKSGWVSERDANESSKWDIYTVKPDGSDVTKVVDNGSWASWAGPDDIVFVRNTLVLRRKLSTGEETPLVDSTKVPDLDGALLQQPELSRDGKFIAITLRGSKRETGIWDIDKKTWRKTGLGCQINWTPDGSSIYWVNPTGNGGSEIFACRSRTASRRRPTTTTSYTWSTSPVVARTNIFPSCRQTANGWCGASPSAGTTTTSPTTRSTSGKSARRKRAPFA